MPAGDEGRVFTIWIGEDLLLLLEGSVSERLSKAIGRQRYRFLTLAGSAEGADAELFEEVAHILLRSGANARPTAPQTHIVRGSGSRASRNVQGAGGLAAPVS